MSDTYMENGRCHCVEHGELPFGKYSCRDCEAEMKAAKREIDRIAKAERDAAKITAYALEVLKRERGRLA
jgi:hypothetical protein